MASIQPGDYTFINYSFSSKLLEPEIIILKKNDDTFSSLKLRDQILSLKFDESQRTCTGWHDLTTSTSYPCPERATLTANYDQCRQCQLKTGFNPAFYYAQSISPQQALRNLQPHSLYLAHFGPGVIKVGITWAERGLKRLLEQGARSCMIIKTFPSADIARKYEALASQLEGIVETLQFKTKLQLLSRSYDYERGSTELLAKHDYLISELGIRSENNQPDYLDQYYLGANQYSPTDIVSLKDSTSASGRCLGMIGNTLVFQQDEKQFLLPLNNRKGQLVAISHQEVANEFKPQQTTLF